MSSSGRDQRRPSTIHGLPRRACTSPIVKATRRKGRYRTTRSAGSISRHRRAARPRAYSGVRHFFDRRSAAVLVVSYGFFRRQLAAPVRRVQSPVQQDAVEIVQRGSVPHRDDGLTALSKVAFRGGCERAGRFPDSAGRPQRFAVLDGEAARRSCTCAPVVQCRQCEARMKVLDLASPENRGW